jgi:hypothetical protein
MFARGTIPMHPEDQQLLEIARDLCRKLGYYNLNPDTISWKEKMGIRRLPVDHFMILRGEIQLSSRAMGQLTPEEWRPIIASGLIYYKNLTRNSVVGMLTTMLPIALVVPAVLLLSFKYLEGSVLIYPIILALIVLTFLAGTRFLLQPKNLWFKADVEAAGLLGKESLVASLRKIDKLDPNRSGKRGGLARPSPSDRVENLARTD